MKCEENIKKRKRLTPSMTKGKLRYRLTLKTGEIKEFKTELGLKARICEKVREKREDDIIKVERKKGKVVHVPHPESEMCRFEEKDKMDWKDVTETYSIFWKNEEVKRQCYPPNNS